jgi:hypothetical protein
MEETEQTHESPAEDDALKGADVTSGTGEDPKEHPEQEGEAGEANRTNPKIGTDDPA